MALFSRTVELYAGDVSPDLLPEVIPQLPEVSHMAFEVLSRQLRRLAEADNPGYVFRTGSALAFLSASVHVIGDPHAFSHVESSHSLRPVYLVSRHGEKIHSQILYIYRDITQRLYSVGVEKHPSCLRHSRQLSDGLYRSHFVVHHHYADQKQLTEYRRSDIGFVFQSYNLIPDLTVRENIEVVADISENPLSVEDVLAALEMGQYVSRFPRELSGGQQQRVAIARALIKNPQLLLCDELTGALDTRSSKEVLKYIARVNEQFGTTVIIVTHNEEIQHMADRITRIKDGKVISNTANNDKKSVEELEF